MNSPRPDRSDTCIIGGGIEGPHRVAPNRAPAVPAACPTMMLLGQAAGTAGALFGATRCGPSMPPPCVRSSVTTVSP